MRILPAGWDAGTNMPDPDAAVYNGRDNAVFTGHGAGSRMHDIQEAEDPLTGTPDTDIGHSFANFIRSFRASTRSPAAPEQWEFLRPVNPDTFILLTPGRDGIYGNLDDVGNFAVKSEER
jgi:hypothetical protein